MTRKCPSCSADVLDNAKFCIKCGTKMPTLTPSPSVASPFAPSNPPPSPIREPSIAESVSGGGSVNDPIKEAVPQQDRGAVKEEVRSSISTPSDKTELNASKSGGKGIIFAVIGIVIVGGGAFFFMSNKQTPIQAPASVSAPAATTTSPTTLAPVTPAPAKPITPASPAAPKPAQKPTEPAAPTSSAPDINKIMRDAANK
jgi:hypothetical protein